MAQFKYKAFISYSHQDRGWANWLHKTLESYRTPRRLVGKPNRSGVVPAKISPVFKDRDDLASATDLSEKINQALADSEHLVVICSPAAASSSWVNKEIESYKKLGRSQNIYCLIVNGEPDEAGGHQDCFPPALRKFYDSDGRQQSAVTEPVAADLRKDKDGKTLARLKIIAGILDVGLDELRQRESLRRQRRYIMITGASMVASVFTLVLALNAIVARDEAEQRRQQAEELLSFMVGDLRTSLEPIGQLDLLESVADRATDYFSTVDFRSLTDQELIRQAQVLTQLGDVRLHQLDYENALIAFEEAYDRSAELVRLSPNSGDRLFQRGQAEFWVGFVHLQTGSSSDAVSWLERYRDTSLQLVMIEPDRDDYKRELGYAYHNLAVMSDRLGDQAAAREGYQYLLDVLQDLQTRDDSVSIQIDMSEAVSFLGDVESQIGDQLKALDYHRQSRELIRSIWSERTTNAVLKERLATASRRVAEIEETTGLKDDAIASYAHSIELFTELAETDQDNAEISRQLAASRLRLARLSFSLGDYEKSELELDATVASLNQFNTREATDFDVYTNLVLSYQLLGRLRHQHANTTAALEASDRGLDFIKEMADSDQLTVSRRAIKALLHLDRARYLEQLGEATLAASELDLAANTIDEGPDEVRQVDLMDAKARILLAQGKRPQAELLISEMDSRNYSPVFPWPN